MTVSVVGELTANRRSIVLMAAGPDHEVAQAAQRLQTLTPLIDNLCACGHAARLHRGQKEACGRCSCTVFRGAALQMPASWAAVVQLAATFGPWWKPGPALTTWVTDELMRRTAGSGELRLRPPTGLTPRPYQVAAARMIGLLGSALLFDDMGTGKTPSTLLGLVERAAAGHPVTPVIIVCPSSGVVDSWLEHIRQWTPFWRAVPWTGSPKRRRRRIGTADIYVTTFATAARDAKTIDLREVAQGRAPLIELGARFVVADEVHKIKDPSSTYSRAVRNLATRVAEAGGGFVGLSGTPITHNAKDIWPTLYCLSPGAFPSSERWALRYCDTEPGADYSVTVLGLNQRAEPEFRDTIVGQYRRVAKADVLSHLPPKVYTVRTVELPEQYRKAYDAFESKMLAELPDGGELKAMGVLSQLGRLLQLASSAADVKTWTEVVEDQFTGLPMEKEHQEVTLKAPSWKVDELLEVLAERPGRQIMTAAPSRQLMMLAGSAAESAGYRVAYVVGNQSAPERRENVRAFQAGERDLICVTTGAGGVGLTLTAASAVVMLQRPWSLVESLQIEDRAHRIGSERHESIEIIDVVAKNTVETRVRRLLKDKAQALSDLVQDPRIVAELLGGAGVRDLRRKDAA